MEPDPLAPARAALARHDWDALRASIPPAPLDDVAAEAQRLDLQAEAAWWLGRFDECIEAREAAFRAFEAIGDAPAAAQCAVWLYEHHGMRARPAIATAWLRRARRLLDDEPACVALGALLLREAELAHGDDRLDDALALAERARRLARDIGSADIEAESLQTTGRILVDAGQPEEGLANLDEAMLLAVEGRLGPYSTGKVYCSLISACEELGDIRRAAEWTEATARWSEQHPFAIFPGICRVHRAVLLEQRGDLARAEQEASLACEELLGTHLPNAVAAFREVGDIRRRLGDLDGAEAAFRRAEELSGGTCGGTALVRLAQGRVEEAQRIIAGCLSQQPPHRAARARLLLAAVQVAVAAGDLDTATASADELEGIASVFGGPMLQAMSLLARGRVELARHDPAAAVAALRVAVGHWQELDVPYEVATTKTVLAQALRDDGDEAAAREAFAAARALFDQVGARIDGDAAPHPGGLTDREVEVLRLLAEGRSNKEIAAQLHLSAKTVSRHLSNIFTKIGVSSRSAATAFAYEQELVARRR